jgi:lipopolysaccharide transport system permease protein
MPGFDPESYVADYVEVLRSLDQAAVDCMAQTIFGAWRARRTVFCCGNGGSASSASHFVMDLAKLTAPRRGPRLRTIALTDSLAAISAIANDIAYEEVFAEQLRSLLEPRDVVIGFSTSGSSPNVLRAIDYANAAGATTIGVTGRGGYGPGPFGAPHPLRRLGERPARRGRYDGGGAPALPACEGAHRRDLERRGRPRERGADRRFRRRHTGPAMTATLVELGRSSNLLFEWTGRTLRARYQQSVMGWLWAVLQPLAQAAILAVVFTYVVPVDTGDTPYLLFVFAGSSVWAFSATSLADMTGAVSDNMTLVNKVHFARAVLPLASMIARLADMGLALAVVWGLALVGGVTSAVSPALLALPVVAAVHALLVVGIGLAASAIHVFVRDVRSIVQLGTQVWFYSTPILYPAERVPSWARPYYDLNPMVGVVESYRAVLLNGAWPDGRLAGAALVSATLAVVGYMLFLKLEPRFADVV